VTPAYAIRVHGFAWPFERDRSRAIYWWSADVPTCESCGHDLTTWDPDEAPMLDGQIVCPGCARAYWVEDAA
jgi:hypothetical protein